MGVFLSKDLKGLRSTIRSASSLSLDAQNGCRRVFLAFCSAQLRCFKNEQVYDV